MRRLWVQNIANRGVNFAAWIDGAIVGHAAVIPDFDKGDGEYIIFILTSYRNKGLGSRLTALTVNKARELSLECLWLTVESYNFRAIRVYKKVGFEFADSDDSKKNHDFVAVRWSLGLRIGIVRDMRYLEHKPGLVHPESPSRLRSLYRMLDKDFADKVITIDPEPATLEQLELVHTPTYIKQILSTAGRDFTSLAPDTTVSANTYLAAWLAVGGCLKGLESVLSRDCRATFCMVRPPGHHALTDRAGGFCIFNNLGVAAKYALEHHGFKRILIMDWDIHHGNALQDLFYKDKRVLYLSTHYMGWYPHTGDWEETGEGDGLGYNVNLPVPKDMEDDDIIHIYREVLTPVVRRFRPQLIFVAAGFDAHRARSPG